MSNSEVTETKAELAETSESSESVTRSRELAETSESSESVTRSRKPNEHNDASIKGYDSGEDTADTDKEEEDLRQRQVEAKKRGQRPIHRASFKRHKADRHYDK